MLTVVGRPEGHPELMKPNSHSLIAAAERLDVDVSLCALIGDSLTDIQAAHTIGSAAIGFADKPHKHRLHASHCPGDQPPAGHLTAHVARSCHRFLYFIKPASSRRCLRRGRFPALAAPALLPSARLALPPPTRARSG
ncbi:HAD hydrolase-like protein [Streptomyces sp. NPDC017524]|uniref:HAD hydrolase-like protein n=1 Tax=Streptomyces sp. NPDC017524 TaxID=3364999 RepID=UPI0037ACBC53